MWQLSTQWIKHKTLCNTAQYIYYTHIEVNMTKNPFISICNFSRIYCIYIFIADESIGKHFAHVDVVVVVVHVCGMRRVNTCWRTARFWSWIHFGEREPQIYVFNESTFNARLHNKWFYWRIIVLLCMLLLCSFLLLLFSGMLICMLFRVTFGPS